MILDAEAMTATEMPTTLALGHIKELERLATNASMGEHYYLGRENLEMQRKGDLLRFAKNNLQSGYPLIKTIREALSLLDQVQRGEVKILRREPTEDMVNKTKQFALTTTISGLYNWHDYAADLFRTNFDAAPPKPEGGAV